MESEPANAETMPCQFCGVRVPAHAWFCPACGASVVSVVSAEKRRAAVGQRPALPGYTVFSPLGWGGSSTVYRARQDSLGRDVAIKLIRQEIDDAAAMRRFEREARIIASLSGHPHVVTIYDVGRTSTGQPFLVTELLDRGSLSDVLARQGALDTKSAVAVGRAVADALSAAHARGILHRDLKPGNVLLGSRGEIKLADFGVARLMAGHSQTTTASIAFTPEHAAPEVLRGEQEGPASDVYGLASTVVTALVGRSPFARRPDERIEAMMWRKMAELPAPLPSSVPAPLADLLRRCLATAPADRPSLDDVVLQLAHIEVSGAAFGPAAEVLTLRQPPSPGAAGGDLAPTVCSESAPTDVLPPPPAGSVGADGPWPDLVTHPTAPAWSVDPFEFIGRTTRWPAQLRRRAVMIGVTLVVVIAGVCAIVLARTIGGGSSSRTTPPATTVAAPSPSTEPAAAATAVAISGASPTTVASTVLSTTIATTTTTAASTTAAVVATTGAPPATNLPVTTERTAPRSAAPRTTAYTPPAVVQTTNPAAPPSSSGGGEPQPVDAAEAVEFVQTYFDRLQSGDFATGWAQLTPEFIDARGLTFERYKSYWRATSLTLDQLRFTAGPAPDEGRVRYAATYTTTHGVIEETDEITLRRGPDGHLTIAEQRIIG